MSDAAMICYGFEVPFGSVGWWIDLSTAGFVDLRASREREYGANEWKMPLIILLCPLLLHCVRVEA